MTSPSRKTAVKTARTKYKHKEIIASNDPVGPSLKGKSRWSDLGTQGREGSLIIHNTIIIIIIIVRTDRFEYVWLSQICDKHSLWPLNKSLTEDSNKVQSSTSEGGSRFFLGYYGNSWGLNNITILISSYDWLTSPLTFISNNI